MIAPPGGYTQETTYSIFVFGTGTRILPNIDSFIYTSRVGLRHAASTSSTRSATSCRALTRSIP